MCKWVPMGNSSLKDIKLYKLGLPQLFSLFKTLGFQMQGSHLTLLTSLFCYSPTNGFVLLV